MSVAVPVAFSALHANRNHLWNAATHVATNGLTPIVFATEFNTLEAFGQVYEYDPTFIMFTAGFFVLLFGALLGLMAYNLMKMYGIDEVYVTLRNSFISWALSDTSSIAAALDTSSEDDWKNM